MVQTTAVATAARLRDFASRFGLPKKIITDNGVEFTSLEFEEFCDRNGIKHVTMAPAHPSTNGLAENAVKDFKLEFKKALLDSKNVKLGEDILIARYLFAYRNTPHSSTGETPSKLMFGRKLRTRFDLMRQDQRVELARERQIDHFAGKKEIVFSIGDLVFARDYRNPNKPGWKKAQIVDCTGPRMYVCKLIENENLIWRRHLDQLIRAEISESSNWSEEKVEEKEMRLERDLIRRGPESTIFKNKQVYEPVFHNESSIVAGNNTLNKQTKFDESHIEDKVLTENNATVVNGRNIVETVIKKEACELPSLNINERPKGTIRKPDKLDL